jgi:hypothetical protein
LHDPNSDEFKEKKSMDELADNCIYVVENLNFHPHEFGYVEPDAKLPSADDKDGQDPPKEENSQPISKGDKKKDTSGKPMSEHEEEVKEIEEPVAEEPEEEKFNSHTIHRFKKSLGNLG